jgi:DnaJ family protein C protein 3
LHTDQSPSDYLLYYKRATAYFSLGRHSHALDDFDKVLSLTGNTFDNALLMKARIHVKDGRWDEARSELQRYLRKMRDDENAKSLLVSVSEGEVAAKKAVQAQKAQLWTVCMEAATEALRTASHSLEIRQERAHCSLAAGDIEGGVGDLTYVYPFFVVGYSSDR